MIKIQTKNSNEYLYILFLILFFITIFPFFIVKYPILVDYPNHLAIFYIQANIDQDIWIKENYIVRWIFNPYLLTEGLGGALARHFDVFIAGKLIIILGFILIISGSILIRRIIAGRIDAWIIINYLLLYNYILFYGFISFYIGLGFSLIAISSWIRFRHVGILRNFLLFSVISTFLFFTHLFALGIYGFFVICYELGKFIYSKDTYNVADCIKAVSQFLVPSVLFIIWWTSLKEYDAGEFYEYGGVVAKFMALLSPISFDFSNHDLYLTFFLLISILLIRIMYPGGVSIYKDMKIPLLGFLVLLFITPRALMGVWEIHCRVFIIFVLLLIASIKFDESVENTHYLRKYIISIAVITLCVKIYFISNTWNRIGRQFDEFEYALQFISKGSKVITVQEESKNLERLDFILYHHMTALSVINRSAFTPIIFTELTPILPSAKNAPIDSPTSVQLNISQLLNNRLKNGYVYGKGQVVYWENWLKDFDYLISIRFENLSIINVKNVRLKFRGSFFDIYQIDH